MAEQFTPGPWHVFSRGVIYIAAEDRTVIAAIEPDPAAMHAPHGANAHLIASAPALYSAGDELADKLWILRCESNDEKSREAAEKALAMWDAARKQARGEA